MNKQILICGNDKGIPSTIDLSIAMHGFEDLDYCVTISNRILTMTGEELRQYDACVTSVNYSNVIFSKMGIKRKEVDCYPFVLHDYMERKIQSTTVGDLFNFLKEEPGDYFVKPKKAKRFAAFCTDEKEEMYNQIINADESAEVYVCEKVKFSSEWRVYVRNHEVVGVCNYSGSPIIFPSYITISKMIKHFKPVAPSCYAMDVGVVMGGTILVEVNDFYSIGNYGLDYTLYAQMLEQRWKEICNKHNVKVGVDG